MTDLEEEGAEWQHKNPGTTLTCYLNGEFNGYWTWDEVLTQKSRDWMEDYVKRGFGKKDTSFLTFVWTFKD